MVQIWHTRTNIHATGVHTKKHTIVQTQVFRTSDDQTDMQTAAGQVSGKDKSNKHKGPTPS